MTPATILIMFYSIDTRSLASALKRIGISFRVPRGVEEAYCRKNEIAVVEKGLEDIVDPKSCREVLVVNERETPFILTTIISYLKKNGFKEIIAGVDPGGKHAYVIIGDGILLDYGYKTTMKNLFDYLCEFFSRFKADLKTVKIGDKWLRVENRLEPPPCNSIRDFIIVDESSSTSETIVPSILGVPKAIDKNLKAAIRIALKQGGIRIESSSRAASG